MNTNSHSESYKAAGVDVTAGYRAVELMKMCIRDSPWASSTARSS